MRKRSTTVIGFLLLAIAGGILVVKWANLPIGETEAVKEDGAAKDAVDQTNLSSAQTVSVEGVGEIRFKSVTKQFPSIDWLRRLKNESEESLLRRIDGEGWNKPDVYFGGNGEILHLAINKGDHKTVPFDSQALKELQDEQGFSIVGVGYPAGLLESGCPPDDFIKETSEYWDRGMGDSTIEIEIAPVIIEIVPTGMPIDELRKPLLQFRTSCCLFRCSPDRLSSPWTSRMQELGVLAVPFSGQNWK